MLTSRLIIAGIVLLTQGRLGHTTSLEGKLAGFLLNITRYSSRFRPVLYDNETVEVKHSLILERIIKVNEKHLLINLNVRVKMQWRDSLLIWDPALYGNITQINLADTDIWTPQIILYNNADAEDADRISFKATVTSDGDVTWVVPMVTKSSCQINVENFPLDEQICKLTFGSWNYDITKLNVKAARQTAFTNQYIPNGEWALISATSETSLMAHFCCKSMVSGVSYVLHIRRLSLFYVTNFIFPCALIAVLTLLVFVMPEDTGERMAVGVTILLSLAVFFLMVEEKMPVSENLPLIGKYYCSTIVEVSFCLVAMCYVLRFVHHRPCSLPYWIQKYILGHLALVVFYDTGKAKIGPKNNPTTQQAQHPRESRRPEQEEPKPSIAMKWKKTLNEKKPELPAVAESRAIKILAESVKEREQTEELQGKWILAANVLTRFFIWLFLCSLIITLLAVFAVDTRKMEI